MGFSFNLGPSAAQPPRPVPKPSNRLLPFQTDEPDECDRQTIFSISNGEIEVDAHQKPERGKRAVIQCTNRLEPPRRVRRKAIDSLNISEPANGLTIPRVEPPAPSEDDRQAGEMLRREATGEAAPKSVTPILSRNLSLTNIRKNAASDSDCLKKHVDVLPEHSISQYDRVAINDFGLAMLTGMGYDPAKHQSRAVNLKKKAYARSGLGADVEMGRVMEELKSTKATHGRSVRR